MERVESLLTGSAAEAVANFSSLAEETYSTTQYSNPAVASLLADTIAPPTDTVLVEELQGEGEGEEEVKDDDLDVNGSTHADLSQLPPAPPISATDIHLAASASASSRLSLPPWPVFVNSPSCIEGQER